MTHITKLYQVSGIKPEERESLEEVARRFAFRSNSYYLSLIDWDDPADPIRRLAIPSRAELDTSGSLDASVENAYTMAPGTEHKYPDTALLLVNDVCSSYCRFCFRKRLFLKENDEVPLDISEGIKYVKRHTGINNVILSGGDPLLLSNNRLEEILEQLSEISHVRVIRIGTKLPAFLPQRIVEDSKLIDILKRYRSDTLKIYLITHFNHPRELTDISVVSIKMIQETGIPTLNQTPIIQGVNDNAETLKELFENLSFAGIQPYYVFICRPTLGNRTYSVPVERALRIFEKSRRLCSGLAKQARLVMSHFSGKIEVLGMNRSHIFMKYIRAANPEDNDRLLIYTRDPDAYWLDEYISKPESSRYSSHLDRSIKRPVSRFSRSTEGN